MATNENNQVLIVGAGPVGLAMALGLRRHGVPVRIIDRNDGPTSLSKALVVWARTLEVLDSIADSTALAALGIQVHGIEFRRGEATIGDVSFSDIPSRFGAGSFIPQSTTEQFLSDSLAALGTTVERHTELMSFTHDENGVCAQLRSPDGAMSECCAGYLVGCDGAHSPVRHGLGMAFNGVRVPDRFALGDVKVIGRCAADKATIFLHADGPCFLAPVVGGRMRVIANMPAADDAMHASSELSFEQLESIVRTRTNLKIAEPHWLSTFQITECVLERYSSGRVFLAGDAAHIHSPAGGQGMNTGIQDAINLAWKIGLHANGIGGERLLESYTEERAVIGHEVVSDTSKLTDVVMVENTALQYLRNAAVHIGARLPVFARVMGRRMAMIDLHYRDEGLRDSDSTHRHHGAIKTGDRFPMLMTKDKDGNDCALEAETCGSLFSLLVIESNETPGFEKACTAVHESLARLEPNVAERIRLIAIRPEGQPELEGLQTLFDTTGDVAKCAGFRGHGTMLVRPDGYVGLLAGALNADALPNWFESL